MEDPPIHEEIPREEAESRLMQFAGDDVDGTFLIRRKGDKLCLSVLFRGKFKHHLILRDGDGNYAVNHKKPVPHINTLVGILARLSSPNTLIKQVIGPCVPLPQDIQPGIQVQDLQCYEDFKAAEQPGMTYTPMEPQAAVPLAAGQPMYQNDGDGSGASSSSNSASTGAAVPHGYSAMQSGVAALGLSPHPSYQNEAPDGSGVVVQQAGLMYQNEGAVDDPLPTLPPRTGGTVVGEDQPKYQNDEAGAPPALPRRGDGVQAQASLQYQNDSVTTAPIQVAEDEDEYSYNNKT
eukprot:m.486047 g.486047  ORF g.486047 m.486047 type:complete len:292 (+) comp24145_c0_seq1:84-959(+)